MVSKQRADISQIQKYLNGELDAEAMHRLEREALDDPFLMDALEGYEQNGAGQQGQLQELSRRLNDRVHKKEKRIIPWYLIPIAASLIGLLIVVKVLYNHRQEVKPAETTAVKLHPELKDKATAPAAILKEPPAIANQKPLTAKIKIPGLESKKIDFKFSNKILKTASPAVTAQLPAKKDTIDLAEVVVTGYMTQKKKDITASASSVVMATPDSNASDMFQGLAATRNGSRKQIRGIVTGKEDGLPIPGAVVKISGAATGTQTDVNGRFTLPADSNASKIIVAYLGYNTKEVKLNNQDLYHIPLSANNIALSEVAVTGYVTQKEADGQYTGAHPYQGWQHFKQYLKENAISPDGKTGKVKVSFVVDAQGKTGDIQIKKGLSPAADQKSAELIQNSPSWLPNTNHQPEKITISIKFVKANER